MQLHNLQPKTPLRKTRRIGRGGKRGTTAGRGTKGQKARAGHKIRPEIREVIKRIPKLRGYKFHSFRAKAFSVSLVELEKRFNNGSVISAKQLAEKGLIRTQHGTFPRIKILGSGAVSKSFSIVGLQISRGARHAVEKAGGSVR